MDRRTYDGQTDGQMNEHMDSQNKNIIPRHSHVAGYKYGITMIWS